jgi:hypothetical protein
LSPFLTVIDITENGQNFLYWQYAKRSLSSKSSDSLIICIALPSKGFFSEFFHMSAEITFKAKYCGSSIESQEYIVERFHQILKYIFSNLVLYGFVLVLFLCPKLCKTKSG